MPIVPLPICGLTRSPIRPRESSRADGGGDARELVEVVRIQQDPGGEREGDLAPGLRGRVVDDAVGRTAPAARASATSSKEAASRPMPLDRMTKQGDDRVRLDRERVQGPRRKAPPEMVDAAGERVQVVEDQGRPGPDPTVSSAASSARLPRRGGCRDSSRTRAARTSTSRVQRRDTRPRARR